MPARLATRHLVTTGHKCNALGRHWPTVHVGRINLTLFFFFNQQASEQADDVLEGYYLFLSRFLSVNKTAKLIGRVARSIEPLSRSKAQKRRLAVHYLVEHNAKPMPISSRSGLHSARQLKAIDSG